MLIKVFANFREICGGKTVTLSIKGEQPIQLVLDELIKDFPLMREELFTEESKLKPLVHVFINGKNIIHLDGLSTNVKQTDEVALFPPVAGG
ncbi:molybdopterin synthase sulfur carrier subunit [Anaerobacillus arseniciselenatis]|uniref:Molybdopterin synthase sulfur carrier subunit n=1 Tax=Anaerobacillus arseniciselenatis TaxID=85682 RepID=A0A1S2LTV2_9BACI|nr:ubiquitin-like small modifier protein 1 [Anaerobacillus arseniciselenatis]OIJ15961.1 molybdopterin synthase sulfur carrier subunit [Anaerobacillus arseniciselenatis]